MSDAHHPQTAPEHDVADRGLQSIARRRAILKGMGKTAALAGAAVPLSSLATKDQLHIPKTGGKNYMCTMSGQNSMMHSALTTNPCGAKAPSHYQTSSNWPSNGCFDGVTAWPSSTKFYDCFGLPAATSGNRSKSIWALVKYQPTSTEAHWITAMLNANKFATSFPYSPSEVKTMYSATNSADALQFFTQYLEQG